MGETLSFSERERWYGDIARELEGMGFREAAIHLRARIAQCHDVWIAQEVAEKQAREVHIGWPFGVRFQPEPSLVQVIPAPQIIEPVIRPDQIAS